MSTESLCHNIPSFSSYIIYRCRKMVVKLKEKKKSRHFYHSIIEKLILQQKEYWKRNSQSNPLNPVIHYYWSSPFPPCLRVISLITELGPEKYSLWTSTVHSIDWMNLKTKSILFLLCCSKVALRYCRLVCVELDRSDSLTGFYILMTLSKALEFALQQLCP